MAHIDAAVDGARMLGGSAPADLAAARQARKDGRPDEAERMLRNLLERPEAGPEVWFELAELLAERRPAEALGLYRRGAAAHPKHLLLKLGLLRARLRCEPETLSRAEAAALGRAHPRHGGAQRLRFDLALALGDFDEAEAAVGALAAIQPDAGDVTRRRVDVLLARREPDAAVDVILANPSRASAVGELGRVVRAIAAASGPGVLEAVLARLAPVPDPLRDLATGNVLFAAEREDEAATAHLHVPAALLRPGGLLRLIHTLKRRGRGAEAVARLGDDPSPEARAPVVRLALAEARWASGDLDGAVEQLAGEPFASARRSALLAEYLAELGRYGEALQVLDAAPVAGEGDARLVEPARAGVLLWRLDLDALRGGVGRAVTAERARALGPRVATRLALLIGDDGLLERGLVEGLPADATPRMTRWTLRESPLGQLLNEMRLSGEVGTLQAAAMDLPLPERVDAVAAAVREGPQWTPVALAFLATLTAAGRFAGAEAGPAGEGGIPRVIHQYWDDDPVPADLGRAMERVRALHPGYEYRRTDRAGARAWLTARGDDRVARAFRLARHPVERADLFRLALLQAEGGVYVDADDVIRRPLDPLLTPGLRFLGFQEDVGSVANDVLAVVPGHPWIGAALEEAVEATLAGAAESLWLRTGPGLLSRHVAVALAEAPGHALPPGHVILPRSRMMHHVAIGRPFAYKLTERGWARPPASPVGTARAR